jgi:hypothetical protein
MDQNKTINYLTSHQRCGQIERKEQLLNNPKKEGVTNE